MPDRSLPPGFAACALLLSRRPTLGVIAATIFVIGVTTPALASDAPAILRLNTYGYDTPGRVPADAAFMRAVRDADPSIDLYIENIDPVRFSGEAQAKLLRAFLRERYAGKRIAVVAAVYERALAFLLDPGDPLFPGVPVVALLTGHPQSLPAHVSYMWAGPTFRESAALALQLHPQTRQIAFVDGASRGATEVVYHEARTQLEQGAPGTELVDLRNLPLDELLTRVSQLPPRTPIFVLRQQLGRRGAAIATADAVRELSAAATGPIYVNSDQQIGSGAFGGIVVSVENDARQLAGMALRIIRDGSLALPPTQSVPAAIFDWRQMKKWGVVENRLPRGSTVLFRVPSAWEQYRGYVLSALVLLIVQSGLITSLVIQGARRRRTERALRENEVALRDSVRQNEDLAGRLITAQEVERGRIARDLHDDISQQLAGLGFMLSALKRSLAGSDTQGVNETMIGLQQRTKIVTDAIRSLSHELHPGVIRHVGLVTALREHCRNVQQDHHLGLTFESSGNLDAIDENTSLCLYRVTQEALNNVIKHAKARTVTVTLRRSDSAIELDIADNGVGFLVHHRGSAGLGLRSIHERVRLTGGSVRIDSRTNHGTTVVVRIPTPPQS